MKVFGFVGSPREKGNTDILVDSFLEGARSSGAEVKKHFLAGMDINQCQGCFRNCMVTPNYFCPIFEDDMGQLQEDMIAADLMLFASPLYCASFTSIMACVFERCIPFFEYEIIGEPGTMEGVKLINNPIKGKKAVIGLVHDLKYPAVAELPFKVFEQVVGRTFMMDIIEKIHVPDVRDKGDIYKKEQQMKEIFELGVKLSATK